MSARSSFKFNPFLGPSGGALLGKVSGFLSLAESTASGGEWPTVVDLLNPGAPMTQTDADRRPAVGNSANGPNG